MQRIRRGDDDKVDILMTDNLTPVIGQQPGAILLPRLIKQFTPAGAQRDNPCTGCLADLRTVRRADVAGRPYHADIELKLSRVGLVVRVHAAVIALRRGRFNHKFPRRRASITAALSDLSLIHI